MASESDLGFTEDGRGVSQARDRGREINGGEVQTTWGEIALRDLAGISRSALEGTRRYRLLYRANGDIRRELLDHVIILNERHLKRLLSSYLHYDHLWRMHRSLEQDAPNGRPVRSAKLNQVVEFQPNFRLHAATIDKRAVGAVQVT